MKTVLLSLMLLGLTTCLHAQSRLNGQVTDTSGTPLAGATVLLLQKADSILAAHTVSGKDGQFEVHDLPANEYWLRITFVGYEYFTKSISLQRPEQLSLGRIVLREKVAELRGVEVKAERMPISVRGDTIQYHADAFGTQPNATVEELLKQLPGIEVDGNGNIKAQGKKVDRVLVEGREFFGDDPKIATQNLPADILDKVQLYDRKSEAAEFTGVDDGHRSATINLQLKEGKKRGYFGTGQAGYGTSGRFATKGNLNRFAETHQISGIGRFNNINEQGFSLQDYFNLMGGMRNAMSGGQLRINPSDLGISLDENSPAAGISTTASGGLNFNSQPGERVDFSANYFFSQMSRNLDQQVERQYFRGSDATFRTFEDENRLATTVNHRLNNHLKYTIDSMQDIQLRANFGWMQTGLSSESFRETEVGETSTGSINTLDKNYQYGQRHIRLDSRAVYRRKLNQAGRSVVAEASYGNQTGVVDGNLASVSRFPGSQLTDSLFQQQNSSQAQGSYDARLSYTEPLGRGHYLEATYQRRNYQEVSSRDFFDIRNGQPVFNQALSNRFNSGYTYDQAIVRLQRNRDDYHLSIGLAAQDARLRGRLQTEPFPVQRRFANLLPRLNWRYEFSAAKTLEFRYQTSVQEPTVEQLQPIVDNSDPLNLYRGNPGLRPEYRHELRVQTVIYDAFSFTSFFALLDARYTRNRITQETFFDDELRQLTRPVNVDEDVLLYGSLSFGTPLRWIKSRFKASLNGSYNHALLPLDGTVQPLSRWNGTLRLSLENRKQDKLSLRAGAEWQLQRTVYQNAPALDQQFSSQSYFAKSEVMIGNKWQVRSMLDYQVFPQGPFARKLGFPLWEAGCSFFAGEARQLEVRLSAFDLLNRNLGVNRRATFNYVENERVVALGRYVMLSVVYQLRRFGQ